MSAQPPDRELANKITARLKELNLLTLSATETMVLEIVLAKVVQQSEICAKALAFERLITDLAGIIPVESRIKKLAGLPLAQALKGFVVVSADEWHQRYNIFK